MDYLLMFGGSVFLSALLVRKTAIWLNKHGCCRLSYHDWEIVRSVNAMDLIKKFSHVSDNWASCAPNVFFKLYKSNPNASGNVGDPKFMIHDKVCLKCGKKNGEIASEKIRCLDAVTEFNKEHDKRVIRKRQAKELWNTKEQVDRRQKAKELWNQK